MEKTKVSKRALQSLLNDSITEAISTLQLPAQTKKIKKLLSKNTKKLALEYATILKKENKRAKKTEKQMADVDALLSGKKKKKISKKKEIAIV